MSTQLSLIEEPAAIRLDLGCGMNKRKDGAWLGVDRIGFEGVDLVHDLTQPWPWSDNSIEEAHSSHFVEHLFAPQRIHFINELYRVLKPGGKATLIAPYYGSERAYGDLTHQWPPVCGMWFYYMSREWRMGNVEKGIGANAPHDDITHNPQGYSCDFSATWGYTMHPSLTARNVEHQQYALQWHREAAQDIIATLVKL